MEISWDSFSSRVAGFLSAGLGAGQICLSLFLARRFLVISLLAGFGLLVLALCCLTYRHLVHIDPQSDVLEQHRRLLFLERNRAFLLSSFTGVGVSSLTIRGIPPIHIVFFVELRGRSYVKLPGIHLHLARAMTRAQRIAKQLNLPADSKTRRIYPL